MSSRTVYVCDACRARTAAGEAFSRLSHREGCPVGARALFQLDELEGGDVVTVGDLEAARRREAAAAPAGGRHV